jgi:SAM-dependent methyltransferase
MAVAERSRSSARAAALYEGFDYRAFWSSEGRRHLDALEHGVIGDLLPQRGGSILDAGCGFGRLTDAYISRFDRVILLDSAWSMLEQARDRWGDRVGLVAADLHALPFRREAFDAVLLVRVLHHVEDPGPVMRSLGHVVAPGGRLVFNISNKRNALRIVRYLAAGAGPNPFARGVVAYGPRSSGCHPSDAEEWMGSGGLRPVRWRGVGIMDKVADRLGPLGRVVPAGRSLARVLGRVRLAPSMFCEAERSGVARERATSVQGPIFRCPRCRDRVEAADSGYVCRRCHLTFPLRDGILDFRVDRSA